MNITFIIPLEKRRKHKMSEANKKSEEEWLRILGQDAYIVCRKKGTEPPFSGKYVDSKVPEPIIASVAMKHYLALLINMIQVQAGLVLKTRF